MNRNLQALQVEMNNATIGVEVEMNNISRAKAAAVAAEYFGTNDSTYEGGTYRKYTCIDMQGRRWAFMHDSSIAGPEDERCEMVTPVLTYADMELLQGLIRALRKAGAKSSPSRGCGVHYALSRIIEKFCKKR